MSRLEPLAMHEGMVIRGKRLGTALGIPTANIPYRKGETAVPDGVYVADILLLDQEGRAVQGVLNQGYHPTVPEGDPSIEVHLFDFNEELYGQRVLVRYLNYLRPEAVFQSKEDMRLVMLEDMKRSRQWFQEHPDYLA